MLGITQPFKPETPNDTKIIKIEPKDSSVLIEKYSEILDQFINLSKTISITEKYSMKGIRYWIKLLQNDRLRVKFHLLSPSTLQSYYKRFLSIHKLLQNNKIGISLPNEIIEKLQTLHNLFCAWKRNKTYSNKIKLKTDQETDCNSLYTTQVDNSNSLFKNDFFEWQDDTFENINEIHCNIDYPQELSIKTEENRKLFKN
jgi:hypothetical protein